MCKWFKINVSLTCDNMLSAVFSCKMSSIIKLPHHLRILGDTDPFNYKVCPNRLRACYEHILLCQKSIYGGLHIPKTSYKVNFYKIPKNLNKYLLSVLK